MSNGLMHFIQFPFTLSTNLRAIQELAKQAEGGMNTLALNSVSTTSKKVS